MIKLGIVMDPIATINIKKDTSFAMLLEAQRRGYELHYMEMNDLYLINGEARARTRTLSVEQNYDKWYDFTGEQDLPLADLDVILMRKDPPFDTEFIYATYILERAEEKGTLIVNKPQSLRDCNEKLFTAWFSELTPETLVTRNKARPLTESDWEIARRVGPTLKAKGLIFVGLDIIGDRLTEINVTSPTCVREIEAAFPDISITGMLMDAIERRITK